MNRPFRRLTIATILVGAFLLAACGSEGATGSSDILAPKTYGIGPGRFTASFTKPPTTTLPTPLLGPAATTNPTQVYLLPGHTIWSGGHVNVSHRQRSPKAAAHRECASVLIANRN